MENKKESQRQEIKSTSRRNIWKIIAISMIGIFVLFIIIGLMRAQHFSSSFNKPTDAEIDAAKKIALDKLELIENNFTSFQTMVIDRMPRKDNNDNKTLVQVVFFNDSVTHTFLIDINSNLTIMHQETEIYIKPKNLSRRGPGKKVGFAFIPYPAQGPGLIR